MSAAPRPNKRAKEKVELWNILHEREVVAGKRPRLRVAAAPNYASPYTILPKKMADALGLLYGGMICVRHEDGRVALRRIARGLCVRVIGIESRVITTDAVIEPKGDRLLLGSHEVKRMGPLVDYT